MSMYTPRLLIGVILTLFAGRVVCIGQAPHEPDEENHDVAATVPDDVFPIVPGAYLDDHAIRQHLTEQAVALRDGGDFVPLSELVDQRDRSRCRLDLPAPASIPRSPAEVCAVRLSGVLVLGELYTCEKCDKWHIQQAAGFLITRDGVFATNHHVFDDKKGDILVAMTSDGAVYPVLEVLAASKHVDVAIARIEMENAPVIPLRADAPVGSSVSLISHPDGRFYMYTQGHIARYSRQHQRGGVATRMAVTADFAKGSSGAPLLDAEGNAVGMVSSTRSVYYEADRKDLQMVFKQCIPARAILELIDTSEVK